MKVRAEERGYRLFIEYVAEKAANMAIAKLSPALRASRRAAEKAERRARA
jgi:hypothetical protein